MYILYGKEKEHLNKTKNINKILIDECILRKYSCPKIP